MLARRSRRRRSHGPARASATDDVGTRGLACRRAPPSGSRAALVLLCAARGRASSSTRRTRTTTRYYSLLWGRELLHLQPPRFEAYRAPTEHPLAIVFGALLSLFGDGARPRDGRARARVASSRWSPGMYRARARLLHAARRRRRRGAACCTRFDFPFLAARGYIDIPYLALVVWAAALEAERPRRGLPVFVLLARGGAAAPGGVAARRPVLAVDRLARDLARARRATRRSPRSAPVIWVVVDFARHRRPAVLAAPTRASSAEELGRAARALARCPPRRWSFLVAPRQVPGRARRRIAGLAARALARAARLGRCRSCCSRRGVGDVRRWSASPACRSSTATCWCRR